jgi:hypothetical protein
MRCIWCWHLSVRRCRTWPCHPPLPFGGVLCSQLSSIRRLVLSPVPSSFTLIWPASSALCAWLLRLRRFGPLTSAHEIVSSSRRPWIIVRFFFRACAGAHCSLVRQLKSCSVALWFHQVSMAGLGIGTGPGRHEVPCAMHGGWGALGYPAGSMTVHIPSHPDHDGLKAHSFLVNSDLPNTGD